MKIWNVSYHNIVKNSNISVNAKRWERNVIRFCLQLYGRNPQGYSDMISSGFMFFPTVRLLQMYRNSVDQGPGFRANNFKWMYNTAKCKELNAWGYVGGIIFDEMAMQEDLQIDNAGGSYKFQAQKRQMMRVSFQRYCWKEGNIPLWHHMSYNLNFWVTQVLISPLLISQLDKQRVIIYFRCFGSLCINYMKMDLPFIFACLTVPVKI